MEYKMKSTYVSYVGRYMYICMYVSIYMYIYMFVYMCICLSMHVNICTYEWMDGWMGGMISAVHLSEIILFSYHIKLRNTSEYNKRPEHAFRLNKRLMEFSGFML